MRKPPACMLMLILLLFLQNAGARDSRLSYFLESGKTYVLDIDIQQNTSSESGSGSQIAMSSRMKLKFRMDSTDAFGLLHMTVRYSELNFSMLAPAMGLDINSRYRNNPLLSSLIDSMLQKEFSLSMTASGELKELRGLEGAFDALGYSEDSLNMEQDVVLHTLDEAYGPNAFKSLFNLFVSYFPTVQPIQNWTRDIIYFFNTKPVKMVNRYFHAKSTDEVLTIQGMGMLNSMQAFEEEIDIGKVSSSLSGSQTYDYQIDPETGWLKKCISRQRVMIEALILESEQFPAGLKIPSYTETLFEVKGSAE